MTELDCHKLMWRLIGLNQLMPENPTRSQSLKLLRRYREVIPKLLDPKALAGLPLQHVFTWIDVPAPQPKHGFKGYPYPEGYNENFHVTPGFNCYQGHHFTKWRFATQHLIELLWGADSAQARLFNSISFGPRKISPAAADHTLYQEFCEGIKSADALLATLHAELEKAWPEKTDSSRPE